MKKTPSEGQIKGILDRWTDKIYPSRGDFEKALMSKKMRIYSGIDPTSSHLHLGHSTNFFLLKAFQGWGHEIIIVIGDFTARIGDPTGRLSVRKALTEAEVSQNMRNYRKQIEKIIHEPDIRQNSGWLKNMTLEKVFDLASIFTHGQMIKRNMFQERLKKNQEIYLTEFLYPLLQGYDSMHLEADAEVGGTDQTFNMLVGRELLKKEGKEKFVITTPLLENPKTGKKLMSKSEGSFIALDDSPGEMFGKIMALPDEAIIPCFKLCTEFDMADIERIETEMKSKEINPRDAKEKLGRVIVEIYYSRKVAEDAANEFSRVFREQDMPSSVPEISLKEKTLPVVDLLVKTKLAPSKSEARRLVVQKGVKIDGKVQDDWQKTIEIKKGMVVQAGKRKFAKLS